MKISELDRFIKADPNPIRGLWMNSRTWKSLVEGVTLHPRTCDETFNGIPVYLNELLADGQIVKVYAAMDPWLDTPGSDAIAS